MQPTHLIAALLAAAPLNAAATAERQAITIDGQFGDWAAVAIAHTDPTGDAAAPDLARLSISDDDRFLFLRIEAAQEFDFSEFNTLEIAIDTDDDPATGQAAGDIGADLVWLPGARLGFAIGQASTQQVSQRDLCFRGAPTVTANEFEIAIALDATSPAGQPIFNGSQIRIRIQDPATGESLPDANASIPYTLGQGNAPPHIDPRPIERSSPTDLRVMTHNVLRDNIFSPFYQPRFERLYTAVAPDILHLQEIYGASATQTRDLVAPWLEAAGLGPAGSDEWHAARVNDNITVSRFPILGSWPIGGNLAVLLDTTPALGSPMLAINAHLFCCGNDAGRQQEVDQIIAFIRDAYTPGGNLTLTPNSPVMIAGDLNLVGQARQLETLLTGDIDNNQAFGPDHAPDPDGSPLTNIISRQTEKRMAYTWRDDTSSFWPGQLDYLIYSDSNLTRRRDFIIYTPEMSQAALDANGLEPDDSLASDHLVFVADFESPCAARDAADLNNDGLLDLADITIFINSFVGQQPPADLAPPAGVYDLNDIAVFVTAFTTDCPTPG